VRGNGKGIQELESSSRLETGMSSGRVGARWDSLLALDKKAF
jgi:hypothetical protein